MNGDGDDGNKSGCLLMKEYVECKHTIFIILAIICFFICFEIDIL